MTQASRPKIRPAISRAEPIPRRLSWWLSFFLFSAANLAFSYFSFPLETRLWIALACFGIPLLLQFQAPYPAKGEPSDPFALGAIPPLPLWVLFPLGLLAVGSRFFRLTSLSSWPLEDEGIFGYFAVQFSQKGEWTITQGLNHLPTLFTWIQGSLFSALGPSLFTLWAVPALWSALSLPAAWFAARSFFPSSLGWTVLGFTSFCFWPLWLGRFSTQTGFMVFWEYATLGILGHYLGADAPGRKKSLILLGIATGIGFYTYLSWTILALIITLALAVRPAKDLSERLFPPLFHLSLSTLIAFPLIRALAGTRGDYLQHIWGFGSRIDWIERSRLYSAYLADLFWGNGAPTFHYGPLWGGLLDPVTGGFFFLGLTLLFRTFGSLKSRCLLFSLPFLCLPAFLTNDLEVMRLAQLIPFLAVVTGLGIQALASTLPSKGRPALFLLFILAAGGTSAHHLFSVYPGHWEERAGYYGDHKSSESFKAYGTLKAVFRDKGPGLILLNFHPDPYDQTLFTATYSFNAAVNPRLDPQKAAWAAFWVNVHERPYLAGLFPDGSWTWLSKGLGRADGGLLLGIVPLNERTRPILAGWLKADRSLQPLTELVMERGVDPNQDLFLQALDRARPSFAGNPLLETRFWRIEALHHCAAGKFEEGVRDYGKALQALPLAHLYNERGELWWKMGRTKEALEDFKSACRMPLNLTNAGDNLANTGNGTSR